jgi:hypothetical protein
LSSIKGSGMIGNIGKACPLPGRVALAIHVPLEPIVLPSGTLSGAGIELLWQIEGMDTL